MNKNNNKSRVVIISGGTLDIDVVFREIVGETFIIGVDSGIDFLYQHKIEPNYLVGDFDSVNQHVIEYYKKQGTIPIREFNPVKDATDTEIAVRLAIELGYKEMVLLGATGSRIDHMLANIQVLSISLQEGVKASIVDSVNRITLLEKKTVLLRDNMYGKYFSVFSLGGKVRGLTICGSKYPLQNHELLPYDSLSVSNQAVDEQVEIEYQEGLLILIEAKEA